MAALTEKQKLLREEEKLTRALQDLKFKLTALSVQEDGSRVSPMKRSDSYLFLPPNMSVVLLGNSWSLKITVEMILLGETEFTVDALDKCVKHSGTFKDKPVTVISTPYQLLIAPSEPEQMIQEIKDQSGPGPHVFLLILKPEYFTEEKKTRLESILESLSEEAFQQTLVLMLRPPSETLESMKKYMTEPHVKDLIIRCRYRYMWMDRTSFDPSDPDVEFRRKELFSRISDMLKENPADGLDPECSEGDTDVTEQKVSVNLVLFGSSALKTSAAEFIGRREDLCATISPEPCEKHQGVRVRGRGLCLLELPSLSGKPLETMMEQCLHCLSLCGPQGVHAFILVLPQGSLTDEDKEELRRLQYTLSPKVLPYTMVLFTGDSDLTAPEKVLFDQGDIPALTVDLKNQEQVSELLQSVDTLMKKNQPHGFTTETLVRGQSEELREKRDRCDNSLRIAVIGKTGTGKSSTGNTIIGNEVFYTKLIHKSVTMSCSKAEGEVGGRRVAVVDTPGLFDNTASDQANQEKLNCISLLDPGPQVFLLVLQIGRFRPLDEQTLELIEKGFGKDFEKFTIVLLTHGDKLERDKTPVEKYIEDCGQSFNKLLEKFGNRYHVFNNWKIDDREQVKELMKKMDILVKENRGECYTYKLLSEAEMEANKDFPKLLKEKQWEHDQKVQKLTEEMKTKLRDHEKKMKDAIHDKSKIQEELLQQKKDLEDERKCLKQLEEQKRVYEEKVKKQAEQLKAITEMLQENGRLEEKEQEVRKEKEKVLKKIDQFLQDQRREQLKDPGAKARTGPSKQRPC